MNLIAKCYVIQSGDIGVEPVIYLRPPNAHPTNEVVREFDNPFAAKNFIRMFTEEKVVVTKRGPTQLLLVRN